MGYTPGGVSSDIPKEQNAVRDWAQGEFEKVAEAFNLFESVNLKKLHNEPEKPREGDVVLADGSNWNPGSGIGYYGYYDGAWHKLG